MTKRTNRIAMSAVSVALLVSVIVSVLAFSAPDALAAALSKFLLSSVLVIVFCLTVGMLLSALRLKFIAADLGYRLSIRDAAVTLSIGQLAGILFFQLAGQMIGRAAMLAGRGVPPAASVIVSGYERIFALCVSLALATCGAIYLFGRLSFDLEAGGLTLIKLAFGLAAVVAAGAALAWGPRARAALRHLTLAVALRAARNAVISLAIQLSTLAAYVVAGLTLAPHIDFIALAAASCVIMFAASLPISLGGWGMREMSAVVALQAVGLPSASALLLALLIGVLSIAVVAATAALQLLPERRHAPASGVAAMPAIDYTMVLDWLVPIAAATAVFFQIYVPVGGNKLNVNLADPLVLIGAAMFVLRQIKDGRPAWRVPAFNTYLAVASAVIALAYLHGLVSFGWTEWAFTNRLLGWPMLLCYGATGALIVRRAHDEGLQTLLATCAAVGAAIAALDLGIVALINLGISSLLKLVDYRIVGFSQNANAFAFVLLVALIAALTLEGRLRARSVLIAAILAGLWYSGSRAGEIATCFVIGYAFISGVRMRPILSALAGATAVLLVLAVLPYTTFGHGGAAGPSAWVSLRFSDNSASDFQHLMTVQQGLAMFISHPLFGAGLGAYMAEQLRQTGVALLIHSTPVWLLAETGLFGFAVFTYAGWRIFALEFSRRGEMAGLLIVLLIAGFAVMAQAHDLLYQRAFWLLMGAALALPAVGRDHPKEIH
jgi:Lysylphosphatidylglycerol synthase TM region/O-Antigen ligase